FPEPLAPRSSVTSPSRKSVLRRSIGRTVCPPPLYSTVTSRQTIAISGTEGSRGVHRYRPPQSQQAGEHAHETGEHEQRHVAAARHLYGGARLRRHQQLEAHG